jgi:hypothetical protein
VDGQQTVLGVVQLRRAVDLLLATETVAASGPELTALLAEVEVQRRRLEALDQLLLAEIDRRGLGGEYGRGSTPNLLSNLLNLSRGEASARVARARDLGPRRAMTGEPLEPILAATAAAVRSGEISAAHVAVITDCLDAIPPAVSVEASGPAEAFLVHAARHQHPAQLRKTAAMLLACINPDGIEPRDEALDRGRGFGLRKYRDGTSTPTGRFTPDVTAMWEAVLDPLAAPQSSPDGEPDTRNPAQRRHDAVGELLTRVLASDTLPAAGGVPVTVLVRTSAAELESGIGVAVTSHGTQLAIGRLLQISGDAAFLSVLCSDTGGILSYGRERRLASKGQRLGIRLTIRRP